MEPEVLLAQLRAILERAPNFKRIRHYRESTSCGLGKPTP